MGVQPTAHDLAIGPDDRGRRMKVVVFNGSPRGRTSNTHLIVEPLLEGARQAGAQTKEVFLVEHMINHCRGCFRCWGDTPGICVQQDDMASLMALFVESDFVGFATPVYGMLMTALLKKFTERLLPLNTPYVHKKEDGSCYHEQRVKRLPRLFLIANSGFPGKHNFDLLKAYLAPQNPVLEVYRNCGELLRDRELAISADTRKRIAHFFEALRSAGGEIAANGQVSAQTREQIQADLMTDEEYTAHINQAWG